MAGAFELQSIEDEDISTWECVDVNGQVVSWNTDPNKCSFIPCHPVMTNIDNRTQRLSWKFPTLWQLYEPERFCSWCRHRVRPAHDLFIEDTNSGNWATSVSGYSKPNSLLTVIPAKFSYYSTLTLDAAMWNSSSTTNSSFLSPIKIDIGPASFTYNMLVANSTVPCEGVLVPSPFFVII